MTNMIFLGNYFLENMMLEQNKIVIAAENVIQKHLQENPLRLFHMKRTTLVEFQIHMILVR